MKRDCKIRGCQGWLGRLTAALLAGAFGAELRAAVVLEDHFDSHKPAARQEPNHRGEWKFTGGVATCIQDDAVYAQSKDHGPILWYNFPLHDGTVRFAIKPEKVKSFVFTHNQESGHAFRFVLTPQGLSVRGWEGVGHEAKASELMPKGQEMPKLRDGEWMQVMLKYEGDRCTISIGPNFQRTFQHPAIATKKVAMGLAFAYGTLSVREVKVESSEPAAAAKP